MKMWRANSYNALVVLFPIINYSNYIDVHLTTIIGLLNWI